MTIINNNAFVTQPVSDVLHIQVDDEATFDAIPGPETATKRLTLTGRSRVCRAKVGVWNGIEIIFQFWLKGDEEDE